MRTLSRRTFAKSAGAAVAGTLWAPRLVLAQGVARVVIVGGGPGGATTAHYIKQRAPKIDVTLVEPLWSYASCFFSNHYIGGLRTLESLNHGYRGLMALGVRVVHDWVDGIEIDAKRVSLRSGTRLTYDRLVVAPGVEFKFDSIAGYSKDVAEIMPHAWKGGPQVKLLRRKLEVMEDGGTVVITAPKLPYRCPPGPYERACVIANYLKTAKPKSKLILLDAKMTFTKQAVFQEAFEKYYKDIIELHLSNDIDDFTVTALDARSGEITTKAGLKVKSAVANIIPEQTAARIALQSGLGDNGWCPINPQDFSSTKVKDVHVLGDASISNDMPKSAFSANSQGKMVAAAIASDLGGAPRVEPRYTNTCYSVLAPDDSVKIGADYAPGDLHGKPGLVASGAFISKPGEPTELRRQIFQDSLAWYPAVSADIFAEAMAAKSDPPKSGRG